MSLFISVLYFFMLTITTWASIHKQKFFCHQSFYRYDYSNSLQQNLNH